MASAIWWLLLIHVVRLAWSLARLNAGNNSAAKIAMMAMTTSSSTRVKAVEQPRLPATGLNWFFQGSQQLSPAQFVSTLDWLNSCKASDLEVSRMEYRQTQNCGYFRSYRNLEARYRFAGGWKRKKGRNNTGGGRRGAGRNWSLAFRRNWTSSLILGGEKSGEVKGRGEEARPHPGPLLRGEGERDPAGWADQSA